MHETRRKLLRAIDMAKLALDHYLESSGDAYKLEVAEAKLLALRRARKAIADFDAPTLTATELRNPKD